MSLSSTKPRKISTKQRIIETALYLFNERRYGNVTTAMLAKEAGVSEGNLWYHFNDKASLLTRLCEDFEAHVQGRLATKIDGEDALENYISFFKIMAEEISKYRFCFRDQADYGEEVSGFMSRVPNYYRQTANQYRTYFNGMREQGHLSISDEKLERVIVNLLILFRYYVEFAHEIDLNEKDGRPAALRAFDLHLSLFCEHLTPEALERLKEALGVDQLSSKIL